MEEKFMLLRGARIIQQLEGLHKSSEEHQSELVEVSTVPDLEDNIERAFPYTTKRQHATGEVNISTIEFIPFVGMKFLHVRSTTLSNGHNYQQALQFQRVQFDEQETPDNISILGNDNQVYHVHPIQLTNHNVKVRCNCLDFHFRFAHYNSPDKSLVGRPPPPYVRKTTTRPPVNPMQVPGMCKHLLKVVEVLEENGLVITT